MKDKLLFGGIIAGIIICISYICFAGEKEELQWKEAYYQKSLQCAQYEIVFSQNELKLVQDRLKVLEKAEEEKRTTTIDNEIKKLKEPKKEEVKK